jgi:hypothetical protein
VPKVAETMNCLSMNQDAGMTRISRSTQNGMSRALPGTSLHVSTNQSAAHILLNARCKTLSNPGDSYFFPFPYCSPSNGQPLYRFVQDLSKCSLAPTALPPYARQTSVLTRPCLHSLNASETAHIKTAQHGTPCALQRLGDHSTQ